MNKKFYILLSILTFLLGMFFFSLKKEWIIFRFPFTNIDSILDQEIKFKNTKKNIKLSYWQNNKWNVETSQLIWSDQESVNVHSIISQLLNLLNEEKVIDKKINLQNAFISSNGQNLYLSFDGNILPTNRSTYDKLMIIESILKTIAQNNIKISKVHFLINNQIMNDEHLDFSNAWPIEGFIKI